MNYVELAIPFFILALALEFLYGWLRKRQTYRLNDTLNSLQLGVLSRLGGVLGLGVSAVALGRLAEALGVTPWSMNGLWQWAAAFVAYDFLYYWKHRYGHEWRIMWASHVVHHQSEEFNLSTALRQTGTDYIGFVFYLPLYLAGVPASVVITVGSLNLIYQFWVHTEHVRRLGVLEQVLVTPSNHRVHHARNPRYIDRNYGGVFILWDRLFGTFEDERDDEPCVYGITRGLRSWNPLWANLHVWYETAALARRAPRWRDKLRVWFEGPGWVPEGLNDGASAAAKPWQYPKFDPPTTPFSRAYVFVQFWLLTAGSLWLISAQSELPRAFALLLVAWLAFSFFVHGAWLEGRRQAQTLEGLRLALALALGVYALGRGLGSLQGPGMVLTGYALASAALLPVGWMMAPPRPAEGLQPAESPVESLTGTGSVRN